MKTKYNILVTGCGGDIGQSIGKILKSNILFDRVVGCDMSSDNAAQFIFDKVIKVPACKSDNYSSALKEIILSESIDIILPISEPELRNLSEQKKYDHFLDKILICANPEAMIIGFDKFETANFLKKNHLPFPETSIITEVTKPQLPAIIKSKNGSGSKSVYVLETMEDFVFYQKKYPDFIIQELLRNAEEEYTCGVFRSASSEVRTIVYKRKLTGGFSGYGEVIENPDVDLLLNKIAHALNLNGSINVQLRMDKKGPCVFEINPRFSSTVRFRHMMGFEDVIWSIQDALKIKMSEYIKPIIGAKFYKGFTEYVN
jgi:carbamoyl-phosphate synthase large subunit